MSKIIWNKDHTPTSIPVSTYIAAEKMGIPVSEYIDRYGNPSEFGNVKPGPNPNHQWGKPSQHTHKGQDR